MDDFQLQLMKQVLKGPTALTCTQAKKFITYFAFETRHSICIRNLETPMAYLLYGKLTEANMCTDKIRQFYLEMFIKNFKEKETDEPF